MSLTLCSAQWNLKLSSSVTPLPTNVGVKCFPITPLLHVSSPPSLFSRLHHEDVGNQTGIWQGLQQVTPSGQSTDNAAKLVECRGAVRVVRGPPCWNKGGALPTALVSSPRLGPSPLPFTQLFPNSRKIYALPHYH